ncbi:MAG: RNA polymerase sigma factor RpoD, partial [uncultured Solirubrobacteraceae bacterium]
PRPDPGGDARPRARGREVRLPQGLQVLDLRDVVDPPGDRPRAGRQGAHHPHPGPRGREAQQDRPRRAQAGHRAGSRAHSRGDRRRHRHRSRGSRLDQAVRPGARLAREAGRRRGGERVRPVHRRRARRVALRARRGDPHQGGAARGAGEPLLPRAPRAGAPLRTRRRAPAHARRGRPDLQRHSRAHPPDREPVAEEVAGTRGGAEAPRRRL